MNVMPLIKYFSTKIKVRKSCMSPTPDIYIYIFIERNISTLVIIKNHITYSFNNNNQEKFYLFIPTNAVYTVTITNNFFSSLQIVLLFTNYSQ